MRAQRAKHERATQARTQKKIESAKTADKETNPYSAKAGGATQLVAKSEDRR